MKFRMKNGVTINLVRETVRTVEIDSQGKPVSKDDALVKRQRRQGSTSCGAAKSWPGGW